MLWVEHTRHLSLTSTGVLEQEGLHLMRFHRHYPGSLPSPDLQELNTGSVKTRALCLLLLFYISAVRIPLLNCTVCLDCFI